MKYLLLFLLPFTAFAESECKLKHWADKKLQGDSKVLAKYFEVLHWQSRWDASWQTMKFKKYYQLKTEWDCLQFFLTSFEDDNYDFLYIFQTDKEEGRIKSHTSLGEGKFRPSRLKPTANFLPISKVNKLIIMKDSSQIYHLTYNPGKVSFVQSFKKNPTMINKKTASKLKFKKIRPIAVWEGASNLYGDLFAGGPHYYREILKATHKSGNFTFYIGDCDDCASPFYVRHLETGLILDADDKSKERYFEITRDTNISHANLSHLHFFKIDKRLLVFDTQTFEFDEIKDE